MEFQYYGANCLRITTKKTSIVVDDNLEKLGLKSVTKPTDISLRTSRIIKGPSGNFTADMPGEYEISGVVIHGIAARAHTDPEGQKTSIVYTVAADELKVVVLGHVHPDMTQDQLAQIGLADITVVPVGDSGYTLDGIGALKIIKEIEPKIVIPTHYADKLIKYEVPQVELAEALKALAMEPQETTAKFKFKPAELTDTTRLIVLQRQ